MHCSPCYCTSCWQLCDTQQTIAHLEKLKNTPGYESLKYYPHFVPSPTGNAEVLKGLGIVMPNSERLMRDYGNGGVVYADATFGLVLAAMKCLLLVVVDGEGHNHLVSAFLTPGMFTHNPLCVVSSR